MIALIGDATRLARTPATLFLRLGLVGSAILLLACGSRTALEITPRPSLMAAPSACSGVVTTLKCVRPAIDDACAFPTQEAPVCDTATQTWRCKDGARPYQRSTPPSDCLPFHIAGGPIRRIGGSLTRVPTDDGTCLWIADEVETEAGIIRNAAFVADPNWTFGTCPTDAKFLDGTLRSVVTVQGAIDATTVVQITGGYRMGGRTRVLYRMFRVDPGAVFGVTELGTGIGRWDASTRRIVIGNPSALRFATDLDLGDAALVVGDYAYVWGCPRLGYLSRACVVGRFDAADADEIFVGGGRWSAGADPNTAPAVFIAGPWLSSVAKDVYHGGLRHLFAPDFGSEIQAQFATAPEGPWSSASSLAPCRLPQGDDKAYCGGPVVHEELVDPLRPQETVVSYGVGTTAGPAPLSGDAYWPRLLWLEEH